MQYDTALREDVIQRISEIGSCDLIIGIPTYNNEKTVAQVLKTIFEGLSRYYPDKKSVVFISDGGSLDYTREIAQRTRSVKGIPKIVSIYRGLPGKGTSLRAVFEAGIRLNTKACAVFDADLMSITPEWVKGLLDPVLVDGYDFVSSHYIRHKYDATITNNIAYSLTRALYGKRVRQPIGGDFGFSERLIEYFTRQDVWDTDVAKFGIDIWMTTLALNEGFKVCESHLGVKIHQIKDPATSLGPMFRQVVGTLFGIMEKYEKVWKKVRGSTSIPLVGKPIHHVELPAVNPSAELLIENFKVGFEHFGSLWQDVIEYPLYLKLKEMAKQDISEFHLPPEIWARIVYDFIYTYHRWAKNRYKLITIMTPIYYGRIGSFVLETRDMSTEDVLEKVVEKQAEIFEQEKRYLLERMGAWDVIEIP
jgi:hypothetical protein